MSTAFRFTCQSCGEQHEGSPSLSYRMPIHYDVLTAEEKQTMGSLGSDLCTIKYAGHTDYFLRVCLDIPIHGAAEGFLWGVWISVSQANFEKYVSRHADPSYEDEYFGWFCNALPFYPSTVGLKACAEIRGGSQRPLIALEPTDHPLAVDSRNGICWDRAVEIATAAMHIAEGKT